MPDDRRAIAERCIDLHVKHAELFRDLDDLKAQLRKFAEASDDTVDGLKAAVRKVLKDDLDVDALKAELRKLGQPGHDGFTEDFPGKGSILVTGGSVPRFKGIVPVLDAAAFLDLADKLRDKLIEDKVVAMQRQFTEARRPSVTVKL